MGTVFTHKLPWSNYGLSWCNGGDTPFQMAVSSFNEECANKIQIIKLVDQPKTRKFVTVAEFGHPYPPSKIMWHPSCNQSQSNLLATVSDELRIWDLSNPQSIKKMATLSNFLYSEFSAPLTSMDWNKTDPSIIGTSSIDHSCTIWDINTSQPKSQILTHDSEVFDISFAQGNSIYASAGGDGSIRMIDIRQPQHSTILFVEPDDTQFVRCGWNHVEYNYLAGLCLDQCKLVILDVRVILFIVLCYYAHIIFCDQHLNIGPECCLDRNS
jgi:WD repeat-containing protein 68